MRVMVIIKATPSSEAGELPSEQLLAEMGKFNEELVAAGIMQAGEGLRPTSEGVRIHFSGSSRSVTDGPFAETKELIAGFWIWEVRSIDEAVEWVKRCPNPMSEDGEIEIRPVYEMDDFANSDPSGEHAANDHNLRRSLAMKNATVEAHLSFAGRCDEALEFYQRALGATVLMKMRYSDSPAPLPEGTLKPGFENKIMHASFEVGQMTLMASDGFHDSSKFEGFRLALKMSTEADCDRAFHALADGGTIDVPLAKTFWSPRYGQVTDKFGVGWMVVVAGDQP